MIQKINNVTARDSLRGQTALVLILLTAAALIFLAITLNWGHIAQTKALITTAADEGATLLASDAASYGEMEKQTYLNNQNKLSASTGGILGIIMVVVSIIVTICSCGQAWPLIVLAVVSVIMAVVNLVLQAVVVQPGITSMWNKLQQDQPIQQQFYEQGIAAALQGSVTDQAQVTDYIDWNANGVFGLNASDAPRDAVSRFAVYYHDRLMMLNRTNPLIPQVIFFYDQLGELMNGETCGQNQNDNYNYGLPVLAQCQTWGVLPFTNTTGGPCTPSNCTTTGIDCVTSANPICQVKVPNIFQLDDACVVDSNTADTSYNPYCDPCCVPPIIQDPGYSAASPNPAHPTPFKIFRPSNCSMPSAMTTPGGDCNPSNPLADPNAADCLPIQSPNECLSPSNPYGNSFPYIYDPSYQNYAANLSFLAKFGRDQQMGPFTTNLTPQGNFPNGIYPFFWLMNNYSPEVDNIDPTIPNFSTAAIYQPQYHWCVAGSAVPSGPIPPSGVPPTGFTDLTQLGTAPYILPYTCSGQDCCVNHIVNSVSTGTPVTSNILPITLVSGPGVNISIKLSTGQTVALTTPPSPPALPLPCGTVPTGATILVGYLPVGPNVINTITAFEASPGTMTNVSLTGPTGLIDSFVPPTLDGTSPANTYVNSFTFSSNVTTGYYCEWATATDNNSVTGQSAVIELEVIAAPTVTMTATGTFKAGGVPPNSLTAIATTTLPDTIMGVVFKITLGATTTTIPAVGSGSTYSATWTVPVGTTVGTSYSIVAVATDSYGLTATSSPPVAGSTS